ncbi:unnamed protein product [Pylaiella littoralis]
MSVKLCATTRDCTALLPAAGAPLHLTNQPHGTAARKLPAGFRNDTDSPDSFYNGNYRVLCVQMHFRVLVVMPVLVRTTIRVVQLFVCTEVPTKPCLICTT